MSAIGKVFLVGAGPGDEGLLTLKGARMLKKAEVVVYDRLVGARILAMASKTAELINVGKNAGNHSVPQEEINHILLEKALEGKLVVRLKGGDPFVFGRGGEELELLEENGVPFEVIPGVTSAIAAAAYAGIPVTHRDFCSSLHIITGHKRADGALTINYEALVALGGTLIFMMSVASVGEIMEGLLAAGISPGTPSAVIENGTKSSQRKLLSSVSEIASDVEKNGVRSPAVIIVGEVCSLSERFDFFSKKPLFGCRSLVTRPQKKAGELSELLHENGAEVVEFPCIETGSFAFDLDLGGTEVAIFSSAAGVESFFLQLERNKLDSRALFGKTIAAVGTATASELLKHGVRADFVPSVFDGETLARELLSAEVVTSGTKVTLFRGDISGVELPAILRKAGAEVLDVAVYKTAPILHENINLDDFDFVTFTSASCVSGFISCFQSERNFSAVNAVCIGKQTAAAAVAAGMRVSVSSEATIPSMVEKLKEVYR